MDMWGADAPCKAYKEKSCRESADELAVHFHVACWDYPHAIVVLRYTRIRSWSLDDRSPWQNLGQTLSSHERPSPEPPAGRRPLRPGFTSLRNERSRIGAYTQITVMWTSVLQTCNIAMGPSMLARGATDRDIQHICCTTSGLHITPTAGNGRDELDVFCCVFCAFPGRAESDFAGLVCLPPRP